MISVRLRWQAFVWCVVLLLLSEPVKGQEPPRDSLSTAFIHQLRVEARPQYVFPTNPFVKGENERRKPVEWGNGADLKYSFKFRPNTFADRVYGGVYQGVGAGYYTFGNRKELGDPYTVYLFQGARIAAFSPRLSLNYEWNFGISGGWQPYHSVENSFNGAVGSRLNAYINAGIWLNWAVSRCFDLMLGADLTHFSNGNTKFPNAGINLAGLKLGVAYNFNRERQDIMKPAYRLFVPPFPRHFSYDLVLFGSWRRKGVAFEGKQYASPESYPVAGLNFAAMYNAGYKLRFGLSLDGVYDGSANVYTEDVIVAYGEAPPPQEFFKPGVHRQLALGLSGRTEYVMPYFTIGIGIGSNVVARGDMRGLYQVLALKVKMSRNAFLHIGYNLQDFKAPNYLMLGMGYRFHNKYPRIRH